MIVFCPGCGARISAPQTPLDGEGVVTCPKCRSQFPTAGVRTDAARSEPKRKFRPKKQSSGAGVGVALTSIVLLLLGGGAFALFHFGVFDRTPPRMTTATTAPGGAITWQEFTSADGKFKVLLPSAPTRKPRSAKETEYSLETPEFKIGVVYANLSEKDKPEKFMVAPSGAKVISEKDVTVDGHPGRDIIAEVSGHGVAHMRFVNAGKRLYTILMVGKSKPASDADVALVFDSFQVTG